MGITIREIAEYANVHRSTVDKVLHHRKGVSEAKRKMIWEIIQKHQYKPNIIGKALQRQSKGYKIIALIVGVDSQYVLKEGIKQAETELVAYKVKVEVRVLNNFDYTEQARLIRESIQSGVDALIIQPLEHKRVRAAMQEVIEKGIPLLQINSRIKEEVDIPYIDSQDFNSGAIGARLMGECLNKGDEIVVFTSHYIGITAIQEREKGFKGRIQSQFPDLKIVEVIETYDSPEVTYRETKRILETYQNLKGIFICCGCVKDLGQALINNAKDRQIKVICFEEYPEIVNLMQEEIIHFTISSNLKEQGNLAVKQVLQHCLNSEPVKQEQEKMRINILVKENFFPVETN